MIRVFILCLFLFGNLSIFFSQDSYYDESVKLLADGKAKKAMSAIDKAIKINGDSSKYYMLKADIDYAINKDINSFFQLLNQSIAVEPNNPRPLINRAYFYDMVQQENNAILDYNDALKIATEDSTIHHILVGRGAIYWSTRKLEVAKEDLLQAYLMDSSHVAGMSNLAMCLDDLGESDEAHRILKRLVKVDSTYSPAWINLGFHCSVHERYDEALVYFDKAISLAQIDDKSTPLIFNNRGYAKFKLGDINGAIKDVKKSIKMLPTNSYAYRNLGLIYLETKDMEKSCENFVLAKRYGYTKCYGDDVDEMLKEHCGN